MMSIYWANAFKVLQRGPGTEQAEGKGLLVPLLKGLRLRQGRPEVGFIDAQVAFVLALGRKGLWSHILAWDEFTFPKIGNVIKTALEFLEMTVSCLLWEIKHISILMALFPYLHVEVMAEKGGHQQGDSSVDKCYEGYRPLCISFLSPLTSRH